MSDLELQQYLFDLQGYLVIENILTPTEVVTLNQLIDQQHLPTPDKQIKIRPCGRRGTGRARIFSLGAALLQLTRPYGNHADAEASVGRLFPT